MTKLTLDQIAYDIDSLQRNILITKQRLKLAISDLQDNPEDETRQKIYLECEDALAQLHDLLEDKQEEYEQFKNLGLC